MLEHRFQVKLSEVHASICFEISVDDVPPSTSRSITPDQKDLEENCSQVHIFYSNQRNFAFCCDSEWPVGIMRSYGDQMSVLE